MHADPVRLIQITDTHLFADVEGTLLGVNTQRSLQGVVAGVAQADYQPEFVLLTGDLVHDGSAAGYQRLGQLLSSLGLPLYLVPGNHDNPPALDAQLRGALICDHKAFSRQNWRFILLNTVAAGEVGGRLAAEQLAFLEQELAAHSQQHCLIALHHPPVSVGSVWLDKIGLQNHREFTHLISRHPQVRAVVFGHVHQEYDRMQGTVRWLGSPSTCVQFKPGEDTFTLDAVAPAFRCISCLPDGRVHTVVVRDHASREVVNMLASHY